MKKNFLLVSLLVMVLMTTGCNFGEKTKVLTCSKKTAVTSDIEMILSYKITYKGEYVKMIETEEKVISSDQEVLELYKLSVEELHEAYKEIDYYDYSVNLSDDTLISTTKIDYTKIDTDKLIEIDSDNAALIKDGKVRIDDIREMYEGLGSICE